MDGKLPRSNLFEGRSGPSAMLRFSSRADRLLHSTITASEYALSRFDLGECVRDLGELYDRWNAPRHGQKCRMLLWSTNKAQQGILHLDPAECFGNATDNARILQAL